jgi:hypothetical protein
MEDNFDNLEKDQIDNLIVKHQKILDTDIDNENSLKFLYEIYRETTEFDKAWCIASVLAHLKITEVEQEEFYTSYKPRGFVKIQRSLNDEIWKKYILPEDIDMNLYHLFTALKEPLFATKAKSYENCNLRKKDQITQTGEDITFVNVFFYISDHLQVEHPELYIKPEEPISFQTGIAKNKKSFFSFGNKQSNIPFLVAGSNVLTGITVDSTIAFLITCELSYFVQGNLLFKLFPSLSELTGIILGAIRLVDRTFDLPGDQQVIDQVASQLSTILTPQTQSEIVQIAQKIGKSEKPIDITKFAKDIQYSSLNAAFALTSDLKSSFEALLKHCDKSYGLDGKAQAAHILRFATSENYFKLRKELGIAIG